MKIAIYVPSWPPGDTPNGIVTYAAQIVPALRRVGHEVFVLTFDKGTNDDPYAIDLRRLASAPHFRDRALLKLFPQTAGFNLISSAVATAVSRLVEKYKIDVIEMEETFGSSFAISRLKLLPVVVRLHGPWFLNGRFNDPHEATRLNCYRHKWEGRAIRTAEFVTAPSAEVLQSVKDYYGFSLPGSRVIANPIGAVAGAELWDINACKKDTFLFVGRFDRRKGGDMVLRAFAELAASYPSSILTFVGSDRGIVQADNTIWTFEHFVRSSFPECLRSRIKFCQQVKHSDVMRLRRKHFATLIASQYEIMPYSVLEAMSHGCPIVATAVGGIPELIQSERNGLLVPAQDVKAMAAACTRLLNDPALAARLGRQASHDCNDSYRPENIARQTVAAYEQAINNFRFSIHANH